MSAQKSSPVFRPGRILRQSVVSGFVLASYLGYAVHEHYAAPAQAVAALPPSVLSGQKLATVAAAPQAANGSQYKDGTYTGPTTNAFYGQVQVQVVIQSGKISSVTLLNYPQDRRTSARINSFAVPQLQSEAVQAQSAKVNVVSGATLTSQAFMASLQPALNSARG